MKSKVKKKVKFSKLEDFDETIDLEIEDYGIK